MKVRVATLLARCAAVGIDPSGESFLLRKWMSPALYGRCGLAAVMASGEG